MSLPPALNSFSLRLSKDAGNPAMAGWTSTVSVLKKGNRCDKSASRELLVHIFIRLLEKSDGSLDRFCDFRLAVTNKYIILYA